MEEDSTAPMGAQFGKWTVVGDEGPTTHGHKRRWLVVCECTPEEVHSVDAYRLRSGYSQSCGCGPRPGRRVLPTVGKQFGKLTVTDKWVVDKDGHTRWTCNCECGGSIDVIPAILGVTVSSCDVVAVVAVV